MTQISTVSSGGLGGPGRPRHLPQLRQWLLRAAGQSPWAARSHAKVRNRRTFLVAEQSGEGQLTEPTAAAQIRGREPLLMPHICGSQDRSRRAHLVGKPPFPTRTGLSATSSDSARPVSRLCMSKITRSGYFPVAGGLTALSAKNAAPRVVTRLNAVSQEPIVALTTAIADNRSSHA